MKLCHLVVLPPPYQRPPGAEIPAMGFAATLKILVKANLLSSLATAQIGTPSASVQSASRRRVYVRAALTREAHNSPRHMDAIPVLGGDLLKEIDAVSIECFSWAMSSPCPLT
jgi:hypothetical protein